MTKYRLEDFHLDLDGKLLTHRDRIVALTPKAVETLGVLLREPETVVSKEQLLDEVWPEQAVGEAVLTQNIYTLRSVLKEWGGDREWIVTVPRRGYRIGAGITVERPSDSDRGRRQRVAVLGFHPHPANEETTALAMVIADAVVAHLGSLGIAAVHPSSGRLGTNVPTDELRRVQRKSDVGTVLRGSIQSSQGQLRVNCELVDCETNASIWAQRFETAATQVFSLQDALCDAIGRRLLGATQRASDLSTTDPATHRTYVRGYYLWSQRSPEALSEAVHCFERATASDPNYAPGWAGLAAALVLLPFYSGELPAAVFPRAEAAAQQALEIDSGLSQAHTTLAYINFLYHWRWEEAERGFKRALLLNPGEAKAHHWYGFMLAALGRYEKAIQHAQRAVELDPLAPVINADLGFVLYFCGRYQDARRQFALVLELSPDFSYAHFGMTLALEACGRLDEALTQAEQAVRLEPGSATMLALRGRLLAINGDDELATETLEKLDSAGAHSIHHALVQVGLGQVEQAVASMAVACVERSSFVVFLNQWPIYDAMRDDPRFVRLVETVGLPRP